MSDQPQPGEGGTTAAAPPTYTPYTAYPFTAPQRGPVSSTQATWALVLAVLPIPLGWLVSLPLAIGVLRDSRDGRGRERGARTAVAALVIVPLWVVLAIVIAVATTGGRAHRDAAGLVTSSGDLAWSALRTGDCLSETPRATGHAATVPVVPCSHDHAGHVFAVFSLPGTEFPGRQRVLELARAGCTGAYDPTRSGMVASESRLFYYLPSRASWSRDRRVVCIAFVGGPAAASV